MHMKSKLTVVIAAVLSTSTYALDIGFESALTAFDSDNIGGINTGPGDLDVPGGLTTEFSFGVFGEHTARNYTGGFDANLVLRQRTGDDDTTSENTITRFLGALDYAITPRGLNWYVGDVLGTVFLLLVRRSISRSIRPAVLTHVFCSLISLMTVTSNSKTSTHCQPVMNPRSILLIGGVGCCLTYSPTTRRPM